MLEHLTKMENDTIEKLAQKIKDTLRDNLVLLELFGSRARGDFKADSDIDVLVIVKNKNVNLRSKLYDILFEIDPYYEYKISLIIYSEFEYQQNIKLKSPFTENLKKEGIRL